MEVDPGVANLAPGAVAAAMARLEWHARIPTNGADPWGYPTPEMAGQTTIPKGATGSKGVAAAATVAAAVIAGPRARTRGAHTQG